VFIKRVSFLVYSAKNQLIKEFCCGISNENWFTFVVGICKIGTRSDRKTGEEVVRANVDNAVYRSKLKILFSTF
jgi:hypothetical protein